MKRNRLGTWLLYALVGAVATTVAAGIAMLLVPHGQTTAVWIAASLAYGLQLIAFAMLLALRPHASLFLAGWLGGMILRFGALGLLAYWLSSTNALPRGATLLSFVAFLFLLMLLEPVTLRWDLRGT